MPIKHPIRATPFGFKVRQARLSLRETQEEFGKRLRVRGLTIHRWENGKTGRGRRIYEELLNALIGRLRQEQRLLPREFIEHDYERDFERNGNAMV